MKKLATATLTLVLAAAMSMTSWAGAWKQDNNGWWYENDDQSYPKNSWQQIGGTWYYFGADGYMYYSTWMQSGNQWYYLLDSGAMAVNQWVGNYYVGSDGAMLTNTTTPDGYQVGSDGAWIPSVKHTSDYDQHSGLEITDFGYTINTSDYGTCTVSYAVEITNHNGSKTIEYPSIQVTARGSDNSVVETEDNVLMGIYANDTALYGDTLYCGSTTPSSVEFHLNTVSDYNIESPSNSSVVPTSTFSVSNVSKLEDDYWTKFTGEVTNHDSTDHEVRVSVIFRKNGALVGGEMTFVTIGAGGTQPFDITSYFDEDEYDSYEIAVIPW